MIQRIIYTLLICAMQLSLSAQQFSFALIQGKSLTGNVSPAELAQKITATNTSEKQKVISIFRWITENIDYKVKPAYARRRTSFYSSDAADTATLKPLNERVAEKVLQEGEAFCDGYARLFNTLCDYAGIKSEVITGYARPNVDRVGRNFSSNHSWNAVLIDSTWHLLDVTWASGYITYVGDRFIRHYDDYFFLTPPNEFIRSHYPEDIRWTLMKAPPTLKEFETMPFKHMGYFTRHIQSYTPTSGIIEAAMGDTLSFEVAGREESDDLRIVDVAEVDSTRLSQVAWWERPKPLVEQKGNLVKAHYVVTNSSVEWLHIIYSNAVILRYRLNIKS